MADFFFDCLNRALEDPIKATVIHESCQSLLSLLNC